MKTIQNPNSPSNYTVALAWDTSAQRWWFYVDGYKTAFGIGPTADQVAGSLAELDDGTMAMIAPDHNFWNRVIPIWENDQTTVDLSAMFDAITPDMPDIARELMACALYDLDGYYQTVVNNV